MGATPFFYVKQVSHTEKKKIEMFFLILKDGITQQQPTPKAKQMCSTLKKTEFTLMIKDLFKQCEERIANQASIACIIDEDDEIALKKDTEASHLMTKLMQIEKLIFTNILNDGKKIIYPRLLIKYDEVLNEIYYIIGELVNMDAVPTEDYLYYCKKSVEIRNMVKKICDFAERHSE